MLKKNDKLILYLLLYENNILAEIYNEDDTDMLKKFNGIFYMKNIDVAKRIFGMDIIKNQKSMIYFYLIMNTRRE